MGHLQPHPNTLSKEQFVDLFGTIYEHSPWVAERSFEFGLDEQHNEPDLLAQLMADVLSKASREEQLALILAHPDLAGKAAARGELTDESDTEQSSAGLDQCSPDELTRFHKLNDAYKAKFDFPFIMAVRGSNRHLILEAFDARLNNSIDAEFETALMEINKIALLRLNAIAE